MKAHEIGQGGGERLQARAVLRQEGVARGGVELETGRTHQIRVHAAHAGYPLAGDEKYGEEEFNEKMKESGLKRMFLHAHQLSFTWPDTGVEFSASAPLPADLAAVIDALNAPKEKKSS